jgi:cell division protease FtsH
MGGRAAEELVLDDMTTGAGNDIERATDMARKMVCEWGMSETVGPLMFGKKEEQIFLGREFAQHRDYSEKTAEAIDNEIRRLVIDAYESAKGILVEHESALHALAESLLEKETLDATDVDKIIKDASPESDTGAEKSESDGSPADKKEVELKEDTDKQKTDKV